MLFIKHNIPAKRFSTDDKPIEHFYAALNFRKKKWLLNSPYNLKQSSVQSLVNCLSKGIDSLLSKYNNLILLGYFNLCMEDSPMKTFRETYKLRTLIKEPTCFRDPEHDA